MSGGPSVLVVDDDSDSVGYMAMALKADFGEVRIASGGMQALLAMEASLPDLVISDLIMPGMDGLELLRMIRERWTEVPVILVTVEQGIARVVEAMQQGASNYLAKPVSPGSLRNAALRALASRSFASESPGAGPREILGSSEAILRVRHLVSLAARCDANVLITGETGSGKELVARALHRLSSLKGGPFVPHNCAVSARDLFESRFFGHVRGAFTGADRDHRGLLEEADGGILFLDELECLSLPNQAKLLRVLDDGRFNRVGSVESRHVCVRILSATNLDPGTMVAQGALREDLYYRLRGFEIRVPALRGRLEDIPELATHFLQAAGVSLSPGALKLLEDSPWPGNVRQLRNVLLSAGTLAQGGTIRARDLTGANLRDPRKARLSADPQEVESPSCESLREMERQALVRALERSGGHRGRAAKSLGIHRSTLRRKLRELQITPSN